MRDDIQIDDDDSFGSPDQNVTLEVGELAYTATALTDGKWYWRVRAFNSVSGAGRWSRSGMFTMDITPTGLASDARVTNKKLKLEWGKVPDAVGYEVQLDTSDSFPLPVIEVGRRTRYTPSTTLTQGVYYWRVRAVDKAGNVSAWSGTRALHLVVGNTVIEPTPSPTPEVTPTDEPANEDVIEPTAPPEAEQTDSPAQ